MFLLSAVRGQEGGGKRPPELPLRNPSTVSIEKKPPVNVRLNLWIYTSLMQKIWKFVDSVLNKHNETLNDIINQRQLTHYIFD